MSKGFWEGFASDQEALKYLKSLPRYKNSALKSLYYRALFFFNLLICKISGREKPLFVVLVTNNDCNLNCTYCYGEYGKRSGKDNYSTKKILQIIDELKSLGTRLLTVHGGETLLRKDIGEVLNYCKWLGFYISVNTNGYLVPRRITELLCVDTLIFSLDGTEDSNDRNRGIGTFKKVMAAIDVSLGHRIPTVISATLTAFNEAQEDMEFLAKLGKSRGIRIQYSLLYNLDKLNQQTGYDGVLSDERIRRLIRKIQDLKREGYPIYYNDNVLATAEKWPELYEKKRSISKADLPAFSSSSRLIPCYHGKLKYQIDADGRVIRCWAHDKKDAPNIKTLGLQQALKACNEDDDCQHCAYLANNEHNAMMDLTLGNLMHIAKIQVTDALSIGPLRGIPWFNKLVYKEGWKKVPQNTEQSSS